MFKENLNLKIIALLLAIFIWVQSTLVLEHKTVVYLPVALINIPENMSFDKLPQKIPFMVKGKGLDIIKLILHKTRLELDASKLKPGTAKLDISDYQITLPEDLDLEILGPANNNELMIRSDVFHRKTVPIGLQFADTYSKQAFESLQYRTFPEKVQVFGPKSKLQKLSRINTLKINRGLINQRDFKIGLIVPDDDISVSDAFVKVSIMDDSSISKVLNNIPIRTDKKVIPSRITIIVKGNRSSIEALRPEMVRVELSELRESDGAYTVNVTIPEDLILVNTTPTKVYLHER